MRMRVLIAGAIFAWTVFGSAQSMPSKTICLAQIGGSEAANWNLRPSVLRVLRHKIDAQDLKISALELDAKDDKRAFAEASEKKCTFVVYSHIDKDAGDVSSQMNPSIYKRGTANPDSTTGSTTIRFTFKIKDANRKKVADDKVDMELLPGFGPRDYEAKGHELVDSVSDKLISAVKG